jgi:hypothetical protein
MYDAPDSTSKITPPILPLRVENKPPEKKRRKGKGQKSPQEKGTDKPESDSSRGKAIDVRI